MGSSLSECNFRYQGQYEDVETGLYYNRFRYYSPDEGMYLSQDPIRLNGGANLYAYIHDPNSWVDVFGLKGSSCGQSQTAASLSDKDFVKRIAEKAERWGIKSGKGVAGSGHAQGSSKHAYADALLQRYQRMTGQKTDLMSETSFLNRNPQPVPRGTAGSARPDVYNPKTGEVFDYKFTKNSSNPISNAQQAHNLQNLPKVTSQTAIHP